MGIKFGDLISRKQISFESLKGKRIAVDFSNTAYQFLSSIRQPDGTPLMDSKGKITSVYVGIMTRFTNLMEKDIHLVAVFDGKPPILKIHEQEERESRKKLAEKKLKEAKKERDDELILRYSKQTSRLTEEIVTGSRELIKALGIPVIDSPSESDAQMGYMSEKGDVWACASSDYDCLIHDCQRLIKNLTLSPRKKLPSGVYVKSVPEMIELQEALKNLGINKNQLLAMAILIGTDYNEGVKGIGPKTAIKLVKQYNNFDELFKEVKAEFDWKQIYAVFKSMPIMKNYQLKWTSPDKEKIMKILIDKHEFNQERVEKNLEKLFKTNKKQEQSSLDKFS